MLFYLLFYQINNLFYYASILRIGRVIYEDFYVIKIYIDHAKAAFSLALCVFLRIFEDVHFLSNHV